jgi:hypothetical protein
MGCVVVVVDFIVVRYSCVCPVLKVMCSHDSKIHMVRHWDKKKPCSYRATVAELASDGCLYL